MPAPPAQSVLREHVLGTIDAIEAILDGPSGLADMRLQVLLHQESSWLETRRPSDPADDFLFNFYKDAISELKGLWDATMADSDPSLEGTDEVFEALVKVVDQRVLMTRLVGGFIEVTPSPS